MAQDWTQTTGALKAFVIILGVVIVVATAVLAVEIFRRAAGGPADERPPAGFATTTVPLPAGARVIDITGGGDTLSLLVELADGNRLVITVDPRSGAVLGTLGLEPER